MKIGQVKHRENTALSEGSHAERAVGRCQLMWKLSFSRAPGFQPHGTQHHTLLGFPPSASSANRHSSTLFQLLPVHALLAKPTLLMLPGLSVLTPTRFQTMLLENDPSQSPVQVEFTEWNSLRSFPEPAWQLEQSTPQKALRWLRNTKLTTLY